MVMNDMEGRMDDVETAVRATTRSLSPSSSRGVLGERLGTHLVKSRA
jgi:hypothetical protein